MCNTDGPPAAHITATVLRDSTREDQVDQEQSREKQSRKTYERWDSSRKMQQQQQQLLTDKSVAQYIHLDAGSIKDHGSGFWGVIFVSGSQEV